VNRLCGAASLLASAIAFTGSAHAQSVDEYFLSSPIPFDVSRGQNIGVLERPRPDYEAEGLRTGGFVVYPRINLGIGHSNNVYGQKIDKVGDAYAASDINVDITSDWTRHSLSLNGGATLRRYSSETLKDENGLHFSATGHLDVGDSSIEALGRVRRGYQTQNSGQFPVDAAQSVPFVQSTGLLRGNYQGDRIRLVSLVDVNRINFQNIARIDGGTLDQNSRDQTIVRGSGRIELAVTRDSAIFAQGIYIDTNYSVPIALNGLASRDSHEWDGLIGATLDLSALVRGTIGFGYAKREYVDKVYGAIGGVIADVRLEYFLTELTTILLEGRRGVHDSITPGSGGFFSSTATLRADHELLRNLLLNLRVALERDSFNNLDRRDTAWNVGGGANYFISRRAGLSLEASYLDRTSRGDAPGLTFNEFRSTLSLLFQL
jgi:hypothetical protein